MQTPSFQHLLVDLDGTLLGANNLPLSLNFVRKTLPEYRKYGGWIKATRALFLLWIQSHLGADRDRFTNDRKAARTFSKIFGIDEEEAKLVLNQTVRTVFPQLKEHFFPLPGARDFIQWASTKYPMTLATNPVWPEEIIRLRLDWAQVDSKCFKSVTHYERMKACKPWKEYYLDLLEQENLKPHQCLLIGDNRFKDLPAVKCGIPVFLLSDSDTLKEVRVKGAKAPAWTGNYPVLRQWLEQSS